MMRNSVAVAVLWIGSVAASVCLAQPSPPEGVRRVVFLGDSITYSGQYVAFIETYLRLHHSEYSGEFLNLGLPSETVSGLSEPGHAGGKFARPELKERLARVLGATKPDLVIACYGMNDGIYYPFAEERFARFQSGMKQLKGLVEARGSKFLVLTPPVFDPLPIQGQTLPAGLAEYPRPFEGYDKVLDRYSGWLLAQRSAGWDVVDIHGPMTLFLNQARTDNPKFFLSGDGVHLGATGHWIIARQVLLHWGVSERDLPDNSSVESALKATSAGSEILSRVENKQAILRDAWLTSTGHQRPGIKDGLTLVEANEKAAKLELEIQRIGKPQE